MRKEVLLEGMKCEGCANTVVERFSSVPGVNEAVANLEAKSVLIQTDAPVNEAELSDSLSDTKYSVVGMKELNA